MKKNQLQASLFWIFLFALILSISAEAKREVTVFPKDSKKFRCQVAPDSVPMIIEEGMVKLRVGVMGASGPFYWRVPFRQWSEGDNNISLAQAGESTAHADEFTIALDVAKLPTEDETKKLELRLIAKNGAETRCTTEVAAIEAAVKLAQKKAPLPVSDFTKQAAVQ